MIKNKITQKILITGMPYSGKTYLSAFFKKNGENAIDADTIKGLGQWVDKKGNKVNFPNNASKSWLDSHDFIWDRKLLRSWLNKQKTTVYFFGLSANVFNAIKLFDKVYYLNVSPDLLKKRFSNNERKNSMGQTQEQQQAILKDLEDFTQKIKEKGAIFVSADQSPEEIYKIIKIKR